MLTPTQILEQMLQLIVKFDGAQVQGSLDQAILTAEANTLFRILRTIEESSKQRFIITATGAYLDIIGQGIDIVRYSGESDDSYRARLAFNEHTWNDCTLNGIKTMIKSYYGIDLDSDFNDTNKIVELYKQAACFYNQDKDTTMAWADDEGWVAPFSDFGAEWLSPTTTPGAFEAHLKAFQSGEEYLIKKRQLHQKLSAIRAAGVVVLLYFHLDFVSDSMGSPESKFSEIELINKEVIVTPETIENYDIEIQNYAITSIVADIKDQLSGYVSRRIMHDKQKNKCHPDYIEDLKRITDPYQLMEMEHGNLARRAEPFRFGRSKLRNGCWNFFYGIKYERMSISIDSKIRIPIKVTIGEEQRIVAEIIIENPDIQYVVAEITGIKKKRSVILTCAVITERYDNINLVSELQTALTKSQIGHLARRDGYVDLSIDDLFAQEYKRIAKYDTYYLRKNPMLDEVHHYRAEDLHGLEFYPIIDYLDFWWRVSTVNEGKISVPSIPQKLTIAKIKDGFSRLWWRITTFDGKIIHSPSNLSPLELVGKSPLPNTTPKLSDIKSWGIQVKQVEPLAICKSSDEMMVIERYNPINKRRWHRADIMSFKLSSRQKNKILIARLPIGAMPLQDPRLFYVTSLLKGNVEEDIISIRFWMPEWLDFLKNTIDEIIYDGFDGVCLDYLNTWQTWLNEQSNADILLRALIAEINKYIKTIKAQKNMFIIARGQEQWYQSEQYLSSIDAIIGERVLFEENQPIESNESDTKINNLNEFYNRQKMVLIMDYILDPDLSEQFLQTATLTHFIPCISKTPINNI